MIYSERNIVDSARGWGISLVSVENQKTWKRPQKVLITGDIKTDTRQYTGTYGAVWGGITFLKDTVTFNLYEVVSRLANVIN